MHYRFHTVDVFTDRPFGGNQLAVFPQAEGLSDAQMQQIARELNLSETVFLSPPDDPAHSRRLRIFTPQIEVPFAGHPTIGTALVLASIGEVVLDGERTSIVLEEPIGPIKVVIRSVYGRPVDAQFTTAVLPEFGPPPPAAADLAHMLSLEESDLLLETRPPVAVSCGLPFLFLPLRDLGAVRRAQLQLQDWRELLSTYWAPHVHVFSHASIYGPEADLH